MKTFASSLLLLGLFSATSVNCRTYGGGSLEMTPCEHLGNIDGYVTQVMSSPFLKGTFEHQRYYNQIIANYNRDLSNAQNNTLSWRNGESTLGLLKKTYQEASVFKAEFNRKYEINRQRLQTLSHQPHSEQFIQKLQTDIRKLEEEIKGAEQALSLSDAPQIKKYFENTINSKRQEIEKKQKEMNQSSKVSLEIAEIIPFLEFVRGDASSVKQLARDSTGRLVTLSENLQSDITSFENQAPLVRTGIRTLASEIQSHQTSLTQNNAEQQRLESEKQDLNTEVNRLTNINGQNLQTISDLTTLMEEKTQAFDLEKEKLCNATGYFQSWFETEEAAKKREKDCNDILAANNVHLDLSAEREQSLRLVAENAKNREDITKILADLEAIDQRIRDLFNAVPDSKTKIQEDSSELANLEAHYGDLEEMQLRLETTKPSLVALAREFLDLQSSFQVFTNLLDGALSQGKAAGNDQEKLSAKQEMEQVISNVQIRLEQLLLPDLEICS